MLQIEGENTQLLPSSIEDDMKQRKSGGGFILGDIFTGINIGGMVNLPPPPYYYPFGFRVEEAAAASISYYYLSFAIFFRVLYLYS